MGTQPAKTPYMAYTISEFLERFSTLKPLKQPYNELNL
jgi:hypothetical protein